MAPEGAAGPLIDEVMPLLRRLWAGETVSHHGAAGHLRRRDPVTPAASSSRSRCGSAAWRPPHSSAVAGCPTAGCRRCAPRPRRPPAGTSSTRPPPAPDGPISARALRGQHRLRQPAARRTDPPGHGRPQPGPRPGRGPPGRPARPAGPAGALHRCRLLEVRGPAACVAGAAGRPSSTSWPARSATCRPDRLPATRAATPARRAVVGGAPRCGSRRSGAGGEGGAPFLPAPADTCSGSQCRPSPTAPRG